MKSHLLVEIGLAVDVCFPEHIARDLTAKKTDKLLVLKWK